jgi:hypothetical protein
MTIVHIISALPFVLGMLLAMGFAGFFLYGYWHVARIGCKSIVEGTPDVCSTYISDLDELLDRDTKQVSRESNIAWKIVERERLRWIGEWLVDIRHNIELYHAAGRYEVENIAGGIPTKCNARLAQQALQKATLCHLSIIYLQMHIWVLIKVNSIGWPLSVPLVKWTIQRCGSEVRSFCALQDMMLKVARTYGRIHYENLWSAM